MGAPSDNVNAIRHGGRSRRHGVVLAKYGKRFSQAYSDSCRLRRQIETLLAGQHGSLNLTQQAKIQTLCRLEQSARASEMLTRDNPDMSSDEVLRHRSMIVQWSAQRDNLLRDLLGDNVGVSDPWAIFDLQRQQAAVNQQAVQGGYNATAMTEGNSNERT